MAIELEFINIIIPISNIEKCSSIGGFKGFLELEDHNLGKTVWYDNYLFREGAMNPFDVEEMIETWTKRGLLTMEGIGEARRFVDICVIDSMNGLTLPCGWIEHDLNIGVAWHGDDPGGSIVGPVGGKRDGIPIDPS